MFSKHILIQDTKTRKTVALLEKTKTIFSLLFFALFLSFGIYLIATGNRASQISDDVFNWIALIGVSFIIPVPIISSIVKAMIRKQKLKTDESEYFSKLSETIAGYKKIFNYKNLLITLGFIAAFVILLVVEIFISPLESDEPTIYGILAILSFAFGICYLAVSNQIRESKFAKQYSSQLLYLKNENLKQSGLSDQEIIKKSKPFTNSTDAQNFLNHVYPTPSIQKHAKRISLWITVVPSLVIGIIIGVLVVFYSESPIEVKLSLWAAFIVSIVIVSIISGTLSRKTIKKQVEILKQDTQKYTYNLELHDLLAQTRKTNNIFTITISLLSVITALLACLIGGFEALNTALFFLTAIFLFSTIAFTVIITKKQNPKQVEILQKIKLQQETESIIEDINKLDTEKENNFSNSVDDLQNKIDILETEISKAKATTTKKTTTKTKSLNEDNKKVASKKTSTTKKPSTSKASSATKSSATASESKPKRNNVKKSDKK